jgi:hypothetical protein
MEREILITVYKHIEKADDVRGQALGYIKLNKVTDVMEFTNFGTIITSCSLELGYITKSDNTCLAGRYRDGLKIMAFVLCRYKYYVRIASDSYYWNFGFKSRSKNKFYYHLYPIRSNQIQKLKATNDANSLKEKSKKMTVNI